jgi:hypothetical protein
MECVSVLLSFLSLLISAIVIAYTIHGASLRNRTEQVTAVLLKQARGEQLADSELANLWKLYNEQPQIYVRAQRAVAIHGVGYIRELTTVEKMRMLWLKTTAEEREAFQIWVGEQARQ